MLLLESEMPVKKAAKILNVRDMRVWRIFGYWIRKSFQADKQDDIRVIGIDETSTKKGHKYVTVAVDMLKKRIIYATPGKDSDTIKNLQTHLLSKGCPKENIEQVSIDMSPAFIKGS